MFVRSVTEVSGQRRAEGWKSGAKERKSGWFRALSKMLMTFSATKRCVGTWIALRT